MKQQTYALWERSALSLVDRLEYAKFHLNEAKELFDSRITSSSKSPLGILFGQGTEDRKKLNTYRLKSGAHIIACVQNLHSLADIIAHVIYYSRIDESNNTLLEKGTDVANVKRWSIKFLHSDAVSVLAKVSPNSDDDFRLLNALSNHGKHRSLVPTGLNFHAVKPPEEWYSVRFAQFAYAGIQFHSCDALSFLDRELAKLINLVEQVLREFQLSLP